MTQVTHFTTETLVNFLHIKGVHESILAYVKEKNINGQNFFEMDATREIRKDVPNANINTLEDIRKNFANHICHLPLSIPCIGIEEIDGCCIRFKCPMIEINMLEPNTILQSGYFHVSGVKYRVIVGMKSDRMIIFSIEYTGIVSREFNYKVKIVNIDEKKSITRNSNIVFEGFGADTNENNLLSFDKLSDGFILPLDAPAFVFEIYVESGLGYVGLPVGYIDAVMGQVIDFPVPVLFREKTSCCCDFW